ARIAVVIPLKSASVTTALTQPLDGAAGGWRATMLQMDTTAVPYGDIVAIHPHHCFVPTASALALGVTDLVRAVRVNGHLVTATPFDTVYVPEDDQEHVAITAENAAWLEREVTG